MADGRFDDRSAYIAGAAWEVLGEEPVEISAPGGKSRSSLRLHFKDRTAIATLRANFRRTHLEAFVLEQLAPHCDDIPKVLGVHNDVLFQSDTGETRLSEEIIEWRSLEVMENLSTSPNAKVIITNGDTPMLIDSGN